MQRFAIIDTSTNKVINVVEYDAAPSDPPPGFDAGIIAVQSNVAGPARIGHGTERRLFRRRLLSSRQSRKPFCRKT
jgi:hypothetical protein